MSRAFIPLSAIVNDYMADRDEEDYGKITSYKKVERLALAALGELQFDSLKSFKTMSLPIDRDTMSLTVPTDYVNFMRIGVLNNDNIFIPITTNQVLPNINQVNMLDSSSQKILDDNGVEITTYDILATPTGDDGLPLTLDGYRHKYGRNGFFGTSGGNSIAGSCIEDKDNGKFFFSSQFPSDIDNVVLEYLADERMNIDPRIHTAAEEAVHNYIYWRHIKKKSNVPSVEKQMARKAFTDAKRTAGARISSPTKTEVLSQFYKMNTQQAPKTGGRYYQ